MVGGFGRVGCPPWRGTPAERPCMRSVVVQVVLGGGSAVRRSPRAALGSEQSWSWAPFQNTYDADVDF